MILVQLIQSIELLVLRAHVTNSLVPLVADMHNVCVPSAEATQLKLGSSLFTEITQILHIYQLPPSILYTT